MEKFAPLGIVFICLCLPNILTGVLVWYFTSFGVSIRMFARGAKSKKENHDFALEQKSEN